MSEFDKFDLIFQSAKKLKISPSNNLKKRRSTTKNIKSSNSKSKQRRSMHENVTSLNKSRSLKSWTSDDEEFDESTDKNDILPHLSCIADDFDKTVVNRTELNNSKDHDDGFDETQPKRLHFDNLSEEIYSPKIEEFSEQEIVISQERERIKVINESIEKLLVEEIRMKPEENYVTGGLAETFNNARSKQLQESLKFLMKNDDEEMNKIQILQYNVQFDDLLFVQFSFVTDLCEGESHFFTLPISFDKFFKDHKIYEVIFDSKKEFEKNKFLHSIKSIMAAKSFQ